jgi:hypothetical protein
MKTRIKSFIEYPDKIQDVINKWVETNNVKIINFSSHQYLDKNKQPTEYIIAYIVYTDLPISL